MLHNLDESHFALNDDLRKLTVSDVQEGQIGVYKCLTEDGSVIKSFEIDSSFRVKKLPKSISVDDGASVEIECGLKAPLTVRYNK